MYIVNVCWVCADGSLEWVSRVGSPDEDQGWDIAFSNETVFYVGYIGGTATFGNPSEQDLITVESYGLYDAYLLATTHDGTRRTPSPRAPHNWTTDAA